MMYSDSEIGDDNNDSGSGVGEKDMY